MEIGVAGFLEIINIIIALFHRGADMMTKFSAI